MLSFPLEQINLFCLTKQHLIAGSLDADAYQVTHDITCLQATSATTPYLSLWARMKSFSPDALIKELYLEKRLVKVKCMRGDLFILPVELIEPAIVATQGQFLNNDLARTYHTMARMINKAKGDAHPFEASETELEQYKNSIIQILKNESLTIEQLKKRLATTINVSYIVYALCDAHILIRGPTTRWDNNKHHYTAWINWLPNLTFQISKEEAQTALIRNYIKSYGPVCLEDIIWWTGFNKEEAIKKIKDISSEIVEISIDCFEGKFLLGQEHLPPLKAVKYLDEPVVNFLPFQDNYIVAYRKRSRHSLRDIYHRIHDRAGNVLPAILIDGQVAGIWDFSNNKVEYTLFDRVDASTDYEVKQKTMALNEFFKNYL